MSNCSRCGCSPMVCVCPAPDLSSHRRPAPATPKQFEFARLTLEDQETMARYLGPRFRQRAPDVVIDSHHSGPYIWRWHIHERSEMPGQYLHIQTTSDPERPLHDHPWDNMSCILSGGYDEIVQMQPPEGDVFTKEVRKGDVVFRRAEFAHRLILPENIPYTISLFTMGRRRRMWGFWIDGTWYEYSRCVAPDPVTQQVFFKDPTAPAA